jgi:RimJ/RimL family protein N-acetyltransferase
MEDGPAMHAVLSNEAAMRYWSTAPHRTLDETTAWVRSMIDAERRGESEDDFVLEWNGRVIGKAGFWRAPEVGFILHPTAQGRGLATEALTCLFDRAFYMRRYPRVIADVDPENQRCLGLLDALGFLRYDQLENTFRVGGEWRHSVFLELHEGRWHEHRATTEVGRPR